MPVPRAANNPYKARESHPQSDHRTLSRWRAPGPAPAQRLGIAARYGDAGDADTLDALPLQGAQWVVSSIREADVNRALLYGLRQHGFRGRVAVATHRASEIQVLRRLGADLILQPYEDAAYQAVDLVVGHDIRPLPLDIPPQRP